MNNNNYFEIDYKSKKLKRSRTASRIEEFNFLINWSQKQINEYFLANDLPRHPLIQDGYLSIGCENCTVKTSNNSNPRSGRWSGTEKTECGTHFSKNSTEKTLG